MQKKRIRKIAKEEEYGFKTLQEAIDDFLQFKVAQGMSELTMRDYFNTFNKFMATSSNTLNIDSLQKELILFLTPLSRASAAKFNRQYSNLNSLFNWMLKQGLIDCNPLLSIGLKKKRDDGRIRCVEVSNIKALLNVMDLKTYVGLRDYVLVLLMLDCGIRPCEAFRAVTEDVDFENGLLTIRKENAKTRTERVLPLSDTILDLLNQLLRVKPLQWNNTLIFCSYDGLPMHTIMFDKRLQYYSQKSGVKVTPYDLRHTFAIMYLRNNGNAFALQKTMGHADLSMTKRYLGLSTNDLKVQHQKASPLQNVIQRNTRVRKLFK